MGKTVLITDAGGRGSALVAAYDQSKQVDKILFVPGNTILHANAKKIQIFPHLKTTSVEEIIQICQKQKVDLIDVAQDSAVESGIADRAQQLGISVVGPTKAAGQIEWDKAWSREFMVRHQILSPKFKICHSQKEGSDFIKNQKEAAWFIKAAGLADGKGAIPASNNAEALEAISQMANFGPAGETFLIEQWLMGEEFSFFAISDGQSYQIVGSAQDHKRMYNFDLGPNTGGMGCSSRPLVVTKPIYAQAESIIKKTLAGLQAENRLYKGVLYLGAIVVDKKVFVIEFNARWGSPEAEVLIPSIKNDFFELGMVISEGKLKTIKLQVDSLVRVSVAVALRPNFVSPKPLQIFGIEQIQQLKDIKLFNTRITKKGQKYFAGNGRLIHIVASGQDVVEARQKAYAAASLLYIEGNNAHYRTDIGWRDVDRLKKRL